MQYVICIVCLGRDIHYKKNIELKIKALLLFSGLSTVSANCGSTLLTERYAERFYETYPRETCIFTFVPPNNRTDMILSFRIRMEKIKGTSTFPLSVKLPDGR